VDLVGFIIRIQTVSDKTLCLLVNRLHMSLLRVIVAPICIISDPVTLNLNNIMLFAPVLFTSHLFYLLFYIDLTFILRNLTALVTVSEM